MNRAAVQALLPAARAVDLDLQSRPRAAYVETAAAFADEMMRVAGCVGVAQFGSVRTPGVSDLDLLVLVEDAAWRTARDRSSMLARTLRDGGFFFWHPPTVLPMSLVGAAHTLHTFAEPKPLAGHFDRWRADGADPDVRFVNLVVWNSYFWAIAATLRFGAQSARKLLLLLGNIAQSTAADYAAMGDRTGAAAVVDRIGTVRAAIVAAPRHEQRRATVDALARALSDWMEADWRLQSTWRDGRPPRPRRVTLHRRTIVDLSYGTRPAAPSFADRVRALAKYAVVALPPVYGDVLSELLPRFPAWQSPRLAGLSIAANPPLERRWREAAASYGAALGCVAAFGRAHDANLFGDPFCTPFNL